MRCGLPPLYVLDHMEAYEIDIYTKHIQFKDRETWEQTRFLSYVVANNNPYRKKELPLKSIMQFPWDNEQGEKGKELNEEEIKALSEKAKAFEKYVTGNG